MLQNLNNYDFIIDVRSQREFRESHIPNAINIPIFNDEQHEKIGKLYKQNSFEAKILGASIACENASKILIEHRDIFKHKYKILIYCAKGGNRSYSLFCILQALNLRVERLDGGYKAYRNKILEYINLSPKSKFLTLCGNTGCGKSELINMASAWSIDLEGICNHYGSSFGFVSGTQPGVKMFQNMLAKELQDKQDSILLIENESKKLGTIVIPNLLYEAYKKAPKILVTCSLQNRITRILKIYQHINDKDFTMAW